MVTRTARPDPPATTEKLEVELLLEGIVRRYGFDLREYDADFVLSHVRRFLQAEGLETVTRLLDRILRDPETLNSLLERLTDSPPQIFSPVRFWRSLRRKVTPRLRTYPSIRAWTVGSPSGGDVYGISILLAEEVSRRSSVYSTHLHEGPPGGIRKRTFTRSELEKIRASYRHSGGSRNLFSYFEWNEGRARFSPSLDRNVVYGSHNLATDSAFNEFHLIVARDIMGGFSEELRKRSYRLLHESLIPLGFLALGRKGDLERSPHRDAYRAVDREAGIYQKIAE
jgi:chemotaxis protein methyltransferase CheR